MSIRKQIEALQKKRNAHLDAMQALSDTAATEERLFTDDEQKAFDKDQGEVRDIDSQLERLEAAEQQLARRAQPALQPAGGDPPPLVEVRAFKPFAAQAFTRYAMALAAAKGNLVGAIEVAKRWERETPDVIAVLRAAVAAGTTTDPTWAGPLVYYQNLVSEFIEFLRPQTIVGQLSGYRTVPFNVRIPRQTAGSTANWVGEGTSKPVSALAFDAITFPFAKLAVIIVITQELARFSNPAAEMLVRDDMVAAVQQAIDTSFIGSTAGVAGVRPAGINNASPNIPSSGNTLAAVTTDLSSALLAMTENNIALRNPVWIMGLQARMFIATLRDPMGNFAFPTMMNKPYSLFGIPVIESNVIVPAGGPPTTSSITLLEQSELMLADDGQTMLDASQEASLQMDSAPATPPTPLVSLWQQNLLGIKAEHFIYWMMRRTNAVQEITGFPAGGSGLPLVARGEPPQDGSGAGIVGTHGTEPAGDQHRNNERHRRS